jgi:hypothetical protein
MGMSRRKRTIRLSLLCVAAGLLGALSPATALAVHEFQTCQNVGANNGKFEEAKCLKEGGAKEYEWKQIPAATNFAVVEKVPSLIISGKILFYCTETEFTGKIELLGQFMGKVELKNSCIFREKVSGNWTNPLNCKVTEPIAFEVKGEMVSGSPEPLFSFGAKGGKVFTKIKTTEPGCSEYAFESLTEGKGQVCTSVGITSGNSKHMFLCTTCKTTELVLNTEGAAFVSPMVIALAGLEWWRST